MHYHLPHDSIRICHTHSRWEMFRSRERACVPKSAIILGGRAGRGTSRHSPIEPWPPYADHLHRRRPRSHRLLRHCHCRRRRRRHHPPIRQNPHPPPPDCADYGPMPTITARADAWQLHHKLIHILIHSLV